MAADSLKFDADFSSLVSELIRATKAFDGFDIKAEQVTDIVTRLAKGSDLLTASLNAVGPAGEKISIAFHQMDEAMAATSLQAGAVAGGFEVVTKNFKQFNEMSVDKTKAEDLKALADAAAQHVVASSQGGSNNPNVLTNQFSQQLQALQQAALNSKAPVDDLVNLIGQSQPQLATATGEVRGFANALFNLGQTAAQTKASNFADLVGQKFAAGTPTNLDSTQQAALTASTRAIGDAAARAGLDEAGFNTILSQSSDELAKVNGTYFTVAQSIINYREELNRLTEKQVAQREETERSNAASASTNFAKDKFLGSGPIAGTNEEITKQTSALATFQREAEKTKLSQADLIELTKNFTAGIVNEDTALAGLNKALVGIQNAARLSGSAQRIAATEDEKRTATANQLRIAQEAIAAIKIDLPIPSDAARNSVNSYTVSLARLQSQIANTKLTSDEVKAIFNAAVNGTGQVFEGEAGKIQSSVNSVVSSYGKLNEASRKFKEENDKTESALTAFFSRVGSQITTILINQLYHAFTQGVESSRQFSLAIVQSQAITAGAGTTYDQFADQVIGVSNAFGIARKDVAEGLFQTLKHEIGDTAESANFLAEAAQFARVSHGSFLDSVNLGTAAINSFNLQGKDAHQVFATLFEAVKSGRLSVGELSNTLGTVGTIGSTVGISMAETTAALAALTHAGVNATQAQTFLRNLFKELITPTKAFNALLGENGFVTGKAAAETLHLTGILNLLQTSANGNLAVTGKYVENLRGIQALLGLTGDKFDVFVHQLNNTKNAQKDYADATKITFQSNAQIYTEFQNQIVNQSAALSDEIVKVIGSIVKAFGGATNAVATFKEIIISFSVAAFVFSIGTVISALAALGVSIGALTIALATNPFTLFAVVAGLAIFAVLDNLKTLEAEEAKRVKAFADGIAKIKVELDAVSAAYKRNIDDQTQTVNTGVSTLQRIYHQLKEDTIHGFQETSDTFRNLVDIDVKLQGEAINKIKSARDQASTESANLTRDTALGQITIQDRIFEEQVRTLTLASQIQERELRAQELVKSAIADNATAKDLAAKGDIENAIKKEQVSKREFEDASKQLDKVAQATLKVTELGKGYSSTIADFIKKDLESEFKSIDESEKRVLESFKRVGQAVKDIHDKTGDASGDSTKFLKNFTAQLTTYLNVLRGTEGGRVRISLRNAVDVNPDLKKVLDNLDPKTIRKLKFDIQIGDQEALKRILADLTLVAQRNAAIQKAQAANAAERIAYTNAIAARNANNFEDERKFLKEAAELSLKSQADGFKNGNVIRAEQNRLEQEILKSYENEATVKGTISKRNEDTYKFTVQNANVVKLQLGVMQDQVKAQQGLNLEFQKAVKALDAQKEAREAELATVRTTFQELEKIKINHNGIVTQDDVDAADKLVAKLASKDNQFQFQDPVLFEKVLTQAAEKAAELKKVLAIKTNQDALESARVAFEQEGKVRLDAEQRIQAKILAFKVESAELAQRIIDSNQKIADNKKIILNVSGQTGLEDKFAGLFGADRETQISHANDAIATAKSRIEDAGKAIASANTQADSLARVLERIKAGTLGALDRDVLERFDAKAAEVLGEGSEVQKNLKALEKQAKDLGIELLQPFKIVANTDEATKPIEALRKSIADLKTEFNVDFRIAPKDVQQHHFGGIVTGPNGIDAVPAMLTAGERVIDAKNSSRFFNQLNSISSGRAPTSNNSSIAFGGVNINLNSSGNVKVDAKALWSEFQKLQSRGLIKELR